MPVPTAAERLVYKSPYKLFQVKCSVRLDYPVFESPYHDDFNGSELDSNKWHPFLPSWGTISVAGGTVLVGTSIPAISPAWFCSKERLAFPYRTDTDWVMTVRHRFPTITGYGVFFRVCTLDHAESIFAVKCNTADGLTAEFPGGSPGTVRWANGLDTSYNRYKLEYTAATQLYTLTIDADDDGVYELGPWSISAVDLQADYIVVGNSTARQGSTGPWTEIKIDWIDVQGTSEAFIIPSWAGPQHLYDPIGYNQEVWALFPSVIGGRISCDKDNVTDALVLDLLNFSHGYKPDSPMYRLYTEFDFGNKPINVESRVSDGRTWTPWRTIFRGGCDRKEIEQRPNGDVVLTLPARDVIRRKLARTRTARAYSDYGPNIEGVIMHKSVQEIIFDLAQNVAGLPYSAVWCDGTPHNKPRNFNIAGEDLASAIRKLLNDVVFCWYPRFSDGQIRCEEWSWGNGVPDYSMSTREELTLVRWSEDAMDHLAILELALENTAYDGGGFSTNFPHAPVPFFGRKSYEDAVVAQTPPSIYARPLHFLRWLAHNRNLGSVVITADCQDWVSHNLELAITDRRFLGISPEKNGNFIIDGWTHEWEGTSRFETQMRLVTRDPQDVIRRSLSGQI